MAAKPHVSAAILQLRWWISAATVVLCLSLATQLLVFGFVHYTDIRWTEVKVEDSSLQVVDSQGVQPLIVTGTGVPRVSAQEARAKSLRNAATGNVAAVAPVELNRVLTGTDRILRRSSETATTVGIMAVLALAAMTCLGVAVAGGASIPGVEKAVTACVWSMVLVVLVVPIRDILPTMPFPGVLSGYEGMTRGSDAAAMGLRAETNLTLLYGVLPAVAIAIAFVVRVWFNEGVDRGVIFTSVSEIDEAMAREMSDISSRGVASGIPRAMGALNRAIGDTPVLQEGDTHPALRMAAGAENSPPSNETLARPIRRATDANYKRPI